MPFGHRAARGTNEILCGECSQPGHNRADQQLKIPDTNTPLSTTPSTPTATSPSPPATPSPTPPSTPFPFPPAENDEMHTASEVESASGTESPAASQGKEKSRSKHTTLRFSPCHRTGKSKWQRSKSPNVHSKKRGYRAEFCVCVCVLFVFFCFFFNLEHKESHEKGKRT